MGTGGRRGTAKGTCVIQSQCVAAGIRLHERPLGTPTPRKRVVAMAAMVDMATPAAARSAVAMHSLPSLPLHLHSLLSSQSSSLASCCVARLSGIDGCVSSTIACDCQCELVFNSDVYQ